MGACLIAGIRLTREKQVNVRVIPTGLAVAESVELAHEIYNRVFRKVPEKMRELSMAIVDEKALVELWNLEDVPVCDDGIYLARSFLESCVKALETVGSSSHFNERFADYKRHHAECEKCNEI